jgi:hypothetical protein
MNDRESYEYDAFVVYSGSDHEWVVDELVPHLEARHSVDVGVNQDDSHRTSYRPQIRLCVHTRDFPIGGDIFDSIWSMMDKSRMVVLVISRSFIRSNYCEYEMNLARMQSVQQGRNLFIPILLEPVEIAEMSDCLSWIVRKLTYVEWPQEEHRVEDREEFWRKVQDAVTDCGLGFNFRHFHNK